MTRDNKEWMSRRSVLAGTGSAFATGILGIASGQQSESSEAAEVVLGELIKGDRLHIVPESTTRQLESTDSLGILWNTYYIQLAIKNVTDLYHPLGIWVQSNLVDSEDYTYDELGTTWFVGQGSIAPGEVRRGYFGYEVPSDAKPVIAELDFSLSDLVQNLSGATIDLTSKSENPHTLEQTFDPELRDVRDSIQLSGLNVTLKTANTTSSLGHYEAPSGYEYVGVDVSIENTSQSDHTIASREQLVLKDGNKYTYPLSFPWSHALGRAIADFLEIPAGERRQGKAAYMVPSDSQPLYWVFDSPRLSEKVRAFWQIR